MVTKDIELKRTSDSTFDWVFSDTDIEDCIGVRRLRSEVIHNICLRRGESDSETYKDKGSTVYEYLRGKNSETNLQYLKEAIIASVKEVQGVEEVEVELHRGDDNVLVDSMKILYNGNEVVLGAI